MTGISREPTEAESKEGLAYVKSVLGAEEPVLLADASPRRKNKSKRRGPEQAFREAEPYQDLFWALLNGTEFLYNH